MAGSAGATSRVSGALREQRGGAAAQTASAAAIVPGTLLSLALTAIRALSDRSAAGPGRDISPPDPEPQPRDLEPQPEPQDLELEPQELEPAEAQEALRDAPKLPAPAVDRRQLRVTVLQAPAREVKNERDEQPQHARDEQPRIGL